MPQRGLGLLQGGRELAKGGAEVLGLGGECPGGDVEVRDQLLELLLAAQQGTEHASVVREQSRESVGLRSEQCLVHDRRVAPGRAAVAERVVERLGPALALHGGILSLVLLGGRRAIEPRSEALEELAQVLAVGLLQRRQDLVELHRGRRLSGWGHAAVGQLRRAWAARGGGEEVVALEEQPRPDLDRGVGVQREAPLVDREGDLGQVAVRLDRRDLAHVDPRDSNGSGLAKRHRVLEHGPRLVSGAGERDRLREREIGPDQDQGDRDRADRGAAESLGTAPVEAFVVGLCLPDRSAPAVARHHSIPPTTLFGFVIDSGISPWFPGVLPITACPGAYGSRPASHSRVWPGDAVFGYGFTCRKLAGLVVPPFAIPVEGIPSLFGE